MIKKYIIGIVIILYGVITIADAQIIKNIGISVEGVLPIRPPESCGTFSYVQQESVTLPSGFISRSINPIKGYESFGYIIAVGSSSEVRVTKFEQIPLSLGSSLQVSISNVTIDTSKAIIGLIDNTTASTRGSLWILYSPPSTRCSGGLACFGIMKVNSTLTIEYDALVGSRITNVYGFAEDLTFLYVLVDGDGTIGGTTHRVLYKVNKSNGVSGSQLTLDTNNNTGGSLNNPALDSLYENIFATESFTDSIKRINTSSFTVTGTTVGLGNDILANAIGPVGFSNIKSIVSYVDNGVTNINANTMVGGVVPLPANELGRTNGVHVDEGIGCQTAHLVVNASAGSVSIQRLNLQTYAFVNTFSVAGFQNGTPSGFNQYLKRLFLGNAVSGETITSVRTSIP